MRRFLFGLMALILVVGFGCTPKPPETPPEKTEAYSNTQYGFTFEYPVERMKVMDRPEGKERRWPYVGIDTDFFMSVRDLGDYNNGQPVNMVNFHAVKDLTVKQFRDALDTQEGVDILSQDSVTMGQVSMTKIVSTTQAEIEKYNYLFESKGSMVIVSIALRQETNFESVLKTFRLLPE